MDDFAKIVRASNGQQVLFYKEPTQDDGNVLHAIACYAAGQADVKVGGLDDGGFENVLDKCDVAYADKVVEQTACFFEDDSERAK